MMSWWCGDGVVVVPVRDCGRLSDWWQWCVVTPLTPNSSLAAGWPAGRAVTVETWLQSHLSPRPATALGHLVWTHSLSFRHDTRWAWEQEERRRQIIHCHHQLPPPLSLPPSLHRSARPSQGSASRGLHHQPAAGNFGKDFTIKEYSKILVYISFYFHCRVECFLKYREILSLTILLCELNSALYFISTCVWKCLMGMFGLIQNFEVFTLAPRDTWRY